ncbi:sodium:alanine symporter family protein [Acuticoccus sp. I52.16.1]|uniref:alanine/glycine:cation symporter family protein n=1 Tax=Acuticoccus sp. I52.16.1 TaxID=2928472 RepID=UPI001FD41CC6|nr:alanine/glycine:cation symporter family protein [Acuticoccus sp. I52.16.1]UOM34601.1 alanine:cation symporter family protein [Acuticoccus sp. I52.16.1]
MQYIRELFDYIGDFTWGWSLIPFLVVLGVFFTLSSQFVQLRFFGRMFGVLTKTEPKDGHISSREALLVSVGGRVGGGNIAGVAVAITLGGPGAVFWMWAIALVGMATSLFECSLAQLFKRTEADGSYRGGPAQYIIYGLGQNFRWLAVLYAICLIAAFAFGFNAFQGNTVAGALQESFGLSRLYAGIGFAILTALVVFGGIRRIAKVADVVVPVMAFGYIGLALVVILINLPSVPGVIGSILSNAFGFTSAVAGGVGAAVAQGLRRGLFSNEAGLGSAPNVAAIADVKHPVSQGVVQSLSVFIDTMVICSCTAFMILLSDVYQPGADIDGVVLTQQALSSHFGDWASYFLSLAVLLFAFSSIIYNYYLGETALAVFTEGRTAQLVLRLMVIALVFIGASAEGATSVFFFSDPLMGVLALVNLMALLMLFPIGLRMVRDYTAQVRAGIDNPVLNPADYPELSLDETAWPAVGDAAPPPPGTATAASA